MAFLKPEQALNKAYRKQIVTRDEMDRFKAAFITLLEKVEERDEEKEKNYVSQFLRDVFYLEYDITPDGSNDLIIRTGKTKKDPVGILFEVKAPANKGEMITQQNLNAKAMQELLLYYLRQRVEGSNNDLRHLVVTNIYEWYVFDAKLFERLFYENKKLIKDFQAWSTGQKTSDSTSHFYKEVAQKYLAEVHDQLEYTYFDITKYEKPLKNADKADDKSLISLYKLLSPQHLLKLPFANDSNSLNKEFYAELLHIIGLQEYKEGGKKLIARKPAGQRDAASLLEMTIRRIEDRNKLAKVQNPARFGDTDEERVYSLGLELCITWINRVLFLKLLEAQLRKYHNGSDRYKFLTATFIPEFDELEKLFFDVLARRPHERRDIVKDKFAHIPYLNSSLFEQTSLEEDVVSITDLDDLATMPVYGSTVLKDERGKTLTKGSTMRTMHYLFAFLDAYSFSSEGGEEVEEQNKRLINAAVLGLIFEKINGYKDGSFFTPGFITMYMCRETIRRATVQKFNDHYGWQVETFEKLHEELAIKDAAKRKEYNEVINSLKICDPAVGSGHFLVSALNEVIAIKFDLGILCYKDGSRVDRDWNLEIQNDELMIQDENFRFFQYHLGTDGKQIPQLQKLQETLFSEKQTIIENCLFGVDINPNSVKICRLRLWIELLKNAYYNAESGYTELETLPNIDINIKEGNSLVSRFALDEDLSDVFKRDKFTIQSYRDAVAAYKETSNKAAKDELLRFIGDIKKQFKDHVYNQDPRRKKLKTLLGQLNLLETMNTDLFGKKVMDEDKRQLEISRLKKLISQREQEIADIEQNKIYRNAFEWRFEFPEVLDDNGEFVGFDVVIGNPPYGVNLNKEQGLFYSKNFESFTSRGESYVLFIEQGFRILRERGISSYITPDTILNLSFTENIRKFLLQKSSLLEIDSLPSNIFAEAVVDTILIFYSKHASKEKENKISIRFFEKKESINDLLKPSKSFQASQSNWFELNSFNVSSKHNELNLIHSIDKANDLLNDFCSLSSGVKLYEVGKGNPPQTAEIRDIKPYSSKVKIDDSWDDFFDGKHVGRYQILWNNNNYIKYGEWLAASREKDIFLGEKLLIRKITGDKLLATYYNGTSYFNTLLFGLKLKTGVAKMSYKSLLGILNSAFIAWYFRKKFQIDSNDTFPQIMIRDILQFAVPNVSNSITIAIETLVTQILAAKEADPNADTTALEAEIDQLVYQLYGLTEEEIKIVEESVG